MVTCIEVLVFGYNCYKYNTRHTVHYYEHINFLFELNRQYVLLMDSFSSITNIIELRVYIYIYIYIYIYY